MSGLCIPTPPDPPSQGGERITPHFSRVRREHATGSGLSSPTNTNSFGGSALERLNFGVRRLDAALRAWARFKTHAPSAHQRDRQDPKCRRQGHDRDGRRFAEKSGLIAERDPGRPCAAQSDSLKSAVGPQDRGFGTVAHARLPVAVEGAGDDQDAAPVVLDDRFAAVPRDDPGRAGDGATVRDGWRRPGKTRPRRGASFLER